MTNYRALYKTLLIMALSYYHSIKNILLMERCFKCGHIWKMLSVFWEIFGTIII